MAEKLILNSFNTAPNFAQSRTANLLGRKVVVYDKSDPSKPRKVAMVDCGNVDDSITSLAERITREPGLEQFQLFLYASSTTLHKSQYVGTRFMDCARTSKHGYWEVYGQLPSSTAQDATNTSHIINATQDAAEIAVFAADPQIPANKSVGCVFISSNATLSQLRDLVADEVELPSELEQFQFVRLGRPGTGPKPPLVIHEDEPTVKICDVMVLGKEKDARVRIAKAPVLSPSLYVVIPDYLLNLSVSRSLYYTRAGQDNNGDWRKMFSMNPCHNGHHEGTYF